MTRRKQPGRTAKRKADNRQEDSEDYLQTVEDLENPTSDTLQKYLQARLRACHVDCKQNVKDNPRCLHGLGEGKKGIWLKVPEKIKNLGVDPSNELKKDNHFVGLENLGATCYMNSLLQTLYMNTPFRKGVYEWPSEQLQPHQRETSVPFQLQSLFAHLQLGLRACHNPTPFTSVLSLKTGVQQDVQEFNKLLLQHLESKFSKCGVPEVKTLIQDLFRGSHAYTTLCLSCNKYSPSSNQKSHFYELNLNIKDIKDICCSLKDFLAEEKMTGSDQYFCENCGGKQDAVRCTKLVELPPVLNLQLMRFVYDMKTQQRRKLMDKVSFPEVLDMSPFLKDTSSEMFRSRPDCPGSESLYDLTAVLNHTGNSAHSGHYTAFIRHDHSQNWWKFDDESVQELSDGLKSVCEEDKGDLAGRTDTMKSFLSSSTAYMLVYTRRGFPPSNPVPSEFIAQLVEQSNQELQTRIKLFRSTKQHVEHDITTRKNLHRSVLQHNADIDSDLGKGIWVPTSWMRDWVQGSDAPLDEALIRSIECEHQRLDPNKFGDMKRLSTMAWVTIVSSLPGGSCAPLTDDDVCMDCVRRIAKDKQDQYVLSAEWQQFQTMLAENAHPPSAYWIDKQWLKDYKKHPLCDRDRDQDINASIVCAHGRLGFPSSKRQLVTRAVWAMLKHKFARSTEFACGSECAVCEVADRSRQESHLVEREKRKEEQRVFGPLFKNPTYVARDLNSGMSKWYVVSSSWLTAWRHYLADASLQSPPPGPINNNTLLCHAHRGLVYDPRVLFAPDFDWSRIDRLNEAFTIVPESSWNQLHQRYKGGPEIVVMSRTDQPVEAIDVDMDSAPAQGTAVPQQGKPQPSTSSPSRGRSAAAVPVLTLQPSLCTECQQVKQLEAKQKALHYYNAPLIVRLLQSTPDLCLTQPKPPPSARSRPVRRTRGLGRELIRVRVNSSDTIGTLRIKICEETQWRLCTPKTQVLHVETTPLLDDSTTLADCHIEPDAEITCVYTTANEEPDEIDSTPSTSNPQLEEGFKGTILLEDSQSSDSFLAQNYFPPAVTPADNHDGDSAECSFNSVQVVKQNGGIDSLLPTQDAVSHDVIISSESGRMDETTRRKRRREDSFVGSSGFQKPVLLDESDCCVKCEDVNDEADAIDLNEHPSDVFIDHQHSSSHTTAPYLSQPFRSEQNCDFSVKFSS